MPRILAIVTFILFSLIAIGALLKDKAPSETSLNSASTPSSTPSSTLSSPIEITLDWDSQKPSITAPPSTPTPIKETQLPENIPLATSPNTSLKDSSALPYANRIDEFFNTSDPRFPFVKTITYKSKVSWQHGRPAWIADYAAHYRTSRHFIGRSLNGKQDYEKQDVGNGDRFNILDPDTNLIFRLIVDTSRCKLWFYVDDQTRQKLTLVKVYDVGLGRLDENKKSGLLTPHGTYDLGDQVAIYKPHTKGNYQGNKIDMIRIFGTRWIPFNKALGNTAESPKGYGIHGAPWAQDPLTTQLVESVECISKYESDGCIRLLSRDIEELFSILISRTTTIEIVGDFKESETAKKAIQGQNENTAP